MTDVGQPSQFVWAQYETQILERLVRMETKLDYSIQTDASHSERITALEKANGPNADHESRIRSLERIIWIATGAAGAGGGVVGALLSHFTGG